MERTWLPTLILAPLIGFGLYRRFKGTFGGQRFAPRRMVVANGPALGRLFSPDGHVVARSYFARGSRSRGIGRVILAIVGLGLTTFETTGDAENDRLGRILRSCRTGS
jgi:hypothetical protein